MYREVMVSETSKVLTSARLIWYWKEDCGCVFHFRFYLKIYLNNLNNEPPKPAQRHFAIKTLIFWRALLRGPRLQARVSQRSQLFQLTDHCYVHCGHCGVYAIYFSGFIWHWSYTTMVYVGIWVWHKCRPPPRGSWIVNNIVNKMPPKTHTHNRAHKALYSTITWWYIQTSK